MELRILLFASFVVSAVSSPIPSKQYRSDYEYNNNTDAFYKLHKEFASCKEAIKTCSDEGAELVKITADEDLKLVQEMKKKFLDPKDLVFVATGVYKGRGSQNTDECNVVDHDGEISTEAISHARPFICQVAATDALPYNAECGVYSNDYESKISSTGSCYRVSTVDATWAEAHALCQAEGAHLVILNSAEELEVLYNMLKAKPHNSETQYYAGVTADTTSETRVFKTVFNLTLEEVGYGPWDENEPNDYEGGENCVALDTRRHGKYNDVPCFNRMPYVCESSGSPSEVPAPSSTPNSVKDPVSSPAPPKHYRPDYEYNEITEAFYKLHTEVTHERDASSTCRDEGAELVKIATDEDLKQIQTMMKKLSNLEDYVMVNSDDYTCKVVNRKGKIETTTCRQQLPFACKVAARDAPYDEECGVYSKDYKSRISSTGSCYRVSRVEATWNEALASCQGDGAQLVVLSSDKELEVLYNMLQDKPHNSETQYFAGVRADTISEPRVFKTVYDETLDKVGYGPWEEGEPNNWHGGENCVALDTRHHGKYNDVWCHARMLYVCESPVKAPLEISLPPSSTPSSATIPVSSPVPSKQYRTDYEYNEKTDAFYKLHTSSIGNRHAFYKCIEEGAELVEITSDEDVRQIHAMMKNLSDLEDYVIVKSKGSSDFEIDQFGYVFNVVNRKGTIERISGYPELPFVCKVAAADAPYHEKCRVYSKGYVSIDTTGSCYRVSENEVTWNEAHASCQADGAHLVILSNAKELEVLYNMLQDKPHHSETQYFAGVRSAWTSEPRAFRTVLNETLEEVGYGPWEESEPNNYEGGENCVVLDTRRHGKYNDVWCNLPMQYVCESSVGAPLEISEPPTPSSNVPEGISGS